MKKTFCLIVLLIGFFLSMQAQQIKHFRFAQITDLHLNPNSPQPTEDLLRSVAAINATDSLDFVLVTGDLTDNGDRISLQKAKSCLDLLRYKYYTIMGNHETKWSESGCTAFTDIFGSERFSFIHGGILFLGFNSGPLIRMALGHVSPQDIAWAKHEIETQSQRLGNPRLPVMLVTHYPILPGDVDNWYEVTDALRPYNVRLFIGGHYHRNKMFDYDGLPGMLTRSNLRDKQGTTGYSIFTITPDSITSYVQNSDGSRRPMVALSLHTNYFDHQGHAKQYPDYSVNKQYSKVKAQWRLATSTAILSSAAILNDHLFVGDDAGNLTAYRLKDGRQLWQQSLKARIVGTPAATDGIVVCGSADKNIYGFDAKSGKNLWTVHTDAPVLGAINITHHTVYVGGSDGIFRAIDLYSGQQKWQYEGVKGYIETLPLVTDSSVIFGAWDNTLYCLNTTNGTERWRWTNGEQRMHFSPAAVWPVSSNGRVFIVDPRRVLTAIDLTTGKTLWSTKQSMVRESIGLSADGLRIYAKTMNDSIVCYSATSDIPRQLWATNARFGYEHATTMLPEYEGTVFSTTKEGLVIALDGKTGRIKWQHKVGNSLVNTVVPIDKHHLVTTSTDGCIYLLKH